MVGAVYNGDKNNTVSHQEQHDKFFNGIAECKKSFEEFLRNFAA